MGMWTTIMVNSKSIITRINSTAQVIQIAITSEILLEYLQVEDMLLMASTRRITQPQLTSRMEPHQTQLIHQHKVVHKDSQDNLPSWAPAVQTFKIYMVKWLKNSFKIKSKSLSKTTNSISQKIKAQKSSINISNRSSHSISTAVKDQTESMVKISKVWMTSLTSSSEWMGLLLPVQETEQLEAIEMSDLVKIEHTLKRLVLTLMLKVTILKIKINNRFIIKEHKEQITFIKTLITLQM